MNATVPAGAVALPRRVSAVIVAVLLACAATAWLISAQGARSMSGPGGMAMLGPGLFLATWVVMMVAMMFPAIVPMVLAHARVVRSRGEGTIPTVAFIGGYLLVWAAAGLVPLAVIQLMGSTLATPVGAWLPRTGGAVIVLAGIYQLTPLKNACLMACRSPLDFVLAHDFGGGGAAAARTGMSHGVHCLGGCWSLMVMLVVLGLMNLALMTLFALVFFVEKNAPRGVMLSRIFGAASIALGLAVIAQPELLRLVGGSMT